MLVFHIEMHYKCEKQKRFLGQYKKCNISVICLYWLPIEIKIFYIKLYIIKVNFILLFYIFNVTTKQMQMVYVSPIRFLLDSTA